MSKCRYDLSKNCNNTDCLNCVFDKIRNEIGQLPITDTAIRLVTEVLDKYEVDKQQIAKSVALLDLFTKTYCRYQNDYGRFSDLKFRCGECLFQEENGDCLIISFKDKYAPDYKDFGSMSDL